VTVGADEDALRRLRAGAFQRPCKTTVGERERLRLRIDVMELERPGVVVVAAEDAGSARLFEEDLLDATPAVADRLDTTSLAAPVAVARRDERREAVPSAEPEGVAARDVLCQRTSALRGQTVALQPVADRRVPPVERGRDLLDRQPSSTSRSS